MNLSHIFRLLFVSVDGDIFKNILNSKQPMSLENLIEKLSPILDKEILNISQKEQLNPIGGQIKFQESKGNVIIDWSFYFKDKSDCLIEKSSQRTISSSALDNQSFEHIQKNSPTYNIDAPIGVKNESI